VLVSLAAPLAVLAAVFGFYRAGYSELASPGPVTLRHTPIQAKCAECHQSTFPHTVTDLRCERCHDPRISGRLEIDAHAAWTPPSRKVAGRSGPLACASCHSDHRGRLASLRIVETLECARCHQFSSLARHPQFATVQTTNGGLVFGHAGHLDEVRRTLGRGCEACHRSTADLSGFEPTSFDRHCAVCHVKSRVLPTITDPVFESLVSAPSAGGGAADVLGGYAIRRPGRGRIVVSGLTHRDPWILQNLRTLNRGLYTEADVKERVALEGRIGDLERARAGSLSEATTADLQKRISTLRSPQGTQPLLERLNVELEQRSSGEAAPISLAARLSEERALESAIAATRTRLAALTDRLSATALLPEERARRTDAILSLATPCLMCHVLQDGRELAPIDVDARRFGRASFTHAPHVIQVGCENCHDTIANSTKATDVNTPGLDTCRKCHATGRAPFACLVCHRYHPSPDVGFGRADFSRR
jgi:hypothetical protein